MHCETGRLSARTSTVASAILKVHRATKACISVPKSFGVVGLVESVITGLILAGTLDVAPMASQWLHSDGNRLEVTQAEPSAPSEATTGNGQGSEPFMEVDQVALTRWTDGQASTFSTFHRLFSALALYI